MKNVSLIIGMLIVLLLPLSCSAAQNPPTAEIQAALNNGGLVELATGEYHIKASLTVPGNTTLRGQGWSTVIIASGNDLPQAVKITGDNVTIENLKIVIAPGAGRAGNRPNVISSENNRLVRLRGLWLIGDKAAGNDGHLARQNGVYFSGTNNSSIVNNVITSTGLCGIALYNSYSNKIADNTLNDHGCDGILLIREASYNLIANNTCENNTYDGISIADTSSHNEIKDNYCYGNGGGMGFYRSRFNTATNNTLANSKDTAMGIHGIGLKLHSDTLGSPVAFNTFIDNLIINNQHEGISLGRYCEHNSFTGNQLSGNGGSNILINTKS